MKYLGYSVAVVCIIYGILLFTGELLENAPSLYRNLFGVVMILYGIYKAVLSYFGRSAHKP